MDWKLAGSTFALIFLAGLGDKTQLATLSLASSSSSRWAVFLGSALALVATSALAVLTGDVIGRFVPTLWLRRGAGVMFIALGLFFLFARSEQ